jgi:hypothetical protein
VKQRIVYYVLVRIILNLYVFVIEHKHKIESKKARNEAFLLSASDHEDADFGKKKVWAVQCMVPSNSSIL